MTKQADEIETELDELQVEEPEVDLDDVEEEAIETAYDETETGDETEAEADEDESVIVTIDGESPSPEDDESNSAPEWVRDLRKQHRDEKRRNRELQEKLDALSGTGQPVELAKKPTLEAAQYDTERFEKDLEAWYDQKRKSDDAEASKKAEQETAQQEWTQKLEGYKTAKTGLKVRDYDDAEEVVQDSLSVTQQGMILQGAENPALLVYALGKNPKRAKELGAINDPVKFAFAVAKLETQLKVSNKKASPKPEKMISGTGRSSGSVDNTLERLRSDAEKTGDFSKVAAYKRQKRAS